MKNNVWEEQGLYKKNSIKELHNSCLSSMGMPPWINELECPFCNHPLGAISIRFVGLKMNTRNLGDIMVEFACYHCEIMDSLYFREGIKTFAEFSEYLQGSKKPKGKAVVEEEMYRQQYNNLLCRVGEKNN